MIAKNYNAGYWTMRYWSQKFAYNIVTYSTGLYLNEYSSRRYGRSASSAGGYVEGTTVRAKSNTGYFWNTKRLSAEVSYCLYYDNSTTLPRYYVTRYGGRSDQVTAGGYVEGDKAVNLKWVGNYWHGSIVRSMQARRAYRLYFWESGLAAAMDSTCYIGRSVSSTVWWLRWQWG